MKENCLPFHEVTRSSGGSDCDVPTRSLENASSTTSARSPSAASASSNVPSTCTNAVSEADSTSSRVPANDRRGATELSTGGSDMGASRSTNSQASSRTNSTDSSTTLRGQQTLDGLQQRLDASGERNPFWKRTGIGSVRTEDSQVSQRSTKLTEGKVKSVANPDMMCRMARGMQKALPFAPSRDDTASASELK